MSTPTTQEAAPAVPATPPAVEPKPAEVKPETDWKAEARKHETRAKENAAAAQKLTDRATQAEKERDEARLEALRIKVGAAKRLPADVVDLLKGDTEEELTAHADRLAEHFKASVRPSGSADQGARGGAPAATPKDEFAAFLKQSGF